MQPDQQERSHLKLYHSLPRAKTLVPDWNSLAVFKVIKPQHKVHPDGIHYRMEVYWHPALRSLIGEKVHIYDFDQTFCHSLTVLHHGQYICKAEPLVHTDVIESDRLKLAQHLEEQKAHKRLVSKRVTRLRKVLKLANVSVRRNIQYDPEPFFPDTISDAAVSDEILIPSYAEEIDHVRDKREATILSETANEIGRTVYAQTRAIEHIINGKPDTPLSDFFEKLGAEPK